MALSKPTPAGFAVATGTADPFSTATHAAKTGYRKSLSGVPFLATEPRAIPGGGPANLFNGAPFSIGPLDCGTNN